jgi:hypothetical protein
VLSEAGEGLPDLKPAPWAGERTVDSWSVHAVPGKVGGERRESGDNSEAEANQQDPEWGLSWSAVNGPDMDWEFGMPTASLSCYSSAPLLQQTRACAHGCIFPAALGVCYSIPCCKTVTDLHAFRAFHTRLWLSVVGNDNSGVLALPWTLAPHERANSRTP